MTVALTAWAETQASKAVVVALLPHKVWRMYDVESKDGMHVVHVETMSLKQGKV